MIDVKHLVLDHLICRAKFPPPQPCRKPATFYLSPYWVEVVSYSPKARIVRFRRVHECGTLRRMSRLRFERQARPA
jgi:hypothetical protein